MSATEQLYRIHWKATRTGVTGHGTGAFTKDEAVDIAANLNRSESGQWCEHWIEPVTTEAESVTREP
jgi:hypothetical protein